MADFKASWIRTTRASASVCQSEVFQPDFIFARNTEPELPMDGSFGKIPLVDRHPLTSAQHAVHDFGWRDLDVDADVPFPFQAMRRLHLIGMGAAGHHGSDEILVIQLEQPVVFRVAESENPFGALPLDRQDAEPYVGL